MSGGCLAASGRNASGSAVDSGSEICEKVQAGGPRLEGGARRTTGAGTAAVRKAAASITDTKESEKTGAIVAVMSCQKHARHGSSVTVRTSLTTSALPRAFGPLGTRMIPESLCPSVTRSAIGLRCRCGESSVPAQKTRRNPAAHERARPFRISEDHKTISAESGGRISCIIGGTEAVMGASPARRARGAGATPAFVFSRGQTDAPARRPAGANGGRPGEPGERRTRENDRGR